MPRLLLALCLLILLVDNADAIECQPTVQGGDGHWSWRLIDGRQCWYKGQSGMDKSLLHWPTADGGSSKIETALEKPNRSQTQPTAEMRPVPLEVLQMLPILPPQPTFEDRWRLR